MNVWPDAGINDRPNEGQRHADSQAHKQHVSGNKQRVQAHGMVLLWLCDRRGRGGGMVVLVEVQLTRDGLLLGQAAGLLLIYQPNGKGVGPRVMAHNGFVRLRDSSRAQPPAGS
jgi:hypothetical protein